MTYTCYINVDVSKVTKLQRGLGECLNAPGSDLYYRVNLMTSPSTGKEDFLVQTYTDSKCTVQRYMWADVCVLVVVVHTSMSCSCF